MKVGAGVRRVLTAIFLICLLMSVAVMPAQNGSVSASPPSATPKLQYFVKLIPPRPTFPADMTPQEQEIMTQHAAYWAELFKTGEVLLIGPVMDPRGAFGMAVLEVSSEAEAHEMADNDPSVKAGLNKVEVSPMHVFLRKQ
jgi:uncharacterized protein YciI